MDMDDRFWAIIDASYTPCELRKLINWANKLIYA
jgi:hypothetical protein